ncbi:hypothetical protein YPPY94_2062 [Yersinia pestis PY-94]|nr:hypothetical protein YpB42003004_1119 [Yersinia pestis biovar Antiqua str. B42003004]EFA45990.1 hypothetical protein YPD27_0176 [Yersinia pestis KIM D27]EIT17784.1 hypothetical protein YPPY94_2062 [Yersinia pestis PY-94]
MAYAFPLLSDDQSVIICIFMQHIRPALALLWCRMRREEWIIALFLGMARIN